MKMWVSAPTRGSGDPSSGRICNSQHMLSWGVWMKTQLCFYCMFMWPHTYRRLNNGDNDQASATGSVRRIGWLRRHTRVRWTPDLITLFYTGPAGGTTSVLSTAVHLQSWCACRSAGPWLFSSGSPAGTLPDLPAAAALCQRGTDETMWGRTHKQHLWFINRLCYY